MPARQLVRSVLSTHYTSHHPRTMALRCTHPPSTGATAPSLGRPSAPTKATPQPRSAVAGASSSSKSVWLLDYGAGNVRSVRNAIKACGYDLKEVRNSRKE